MARYYKKRRYGGKYGKKKRYGKMGYRKMKRSKARLYRQGGNYAAASTKASPELKSYDNLVTNIIATGAANSIGAYYALCDAYSQAVSQFNLQFPAGGAFTNPLTGVAFYEANNVGFPIILNSMTVGAGLNQRIGRQVRMRSIKIDVLLQAPGTLASSSSLGCAVNRGTGSQTAPVRIILGYDRQTNSAAVAARDVLANVGNSGLTGGGNAVSVCSSNNLNNRSRFLILYDKTFTLNSVDTPYKMVRIYKKMNLPVIFSSNVPSNPWDWNTVQTGALFVMMVSDGDPTLFGTVNTDSTVTPTVLTQPLPYCVMGSSRLRFHDQ